MARVLWLSSVCVTGAIALAAVSSAAPSIYAEARKVCSERYDLELSAKTVPPGMSKSRYLSQCTNSYVRSAALENTLDDAEGGQGGPEILPPGSDDVVSISRSLAEKTAKKVIPTPRFKPAQ